MRHKLMSVGVVIGVFAWTAAAASADGPLSRPGVTCDDYDNHSEAQRAADTRDADGDGVYCEALPCPCAGPGDVNTGGGGEPNREPKPKPAKPRAQLIDARIIDVVDGDTVKVRAFGARRRFYTVRLIGIDTPETRKPFFSRNFRYSLDTS